MAFPLKSSFTLDQSGRKIQNCGNGSGLPQIPNGLKWPGGLGFHPIAAIEAKCNLDFPLSCFGERNKEREISE